MGTTFGTSVPATILFSSEMARRHAYTLSSPTSFQQRISAVTAYNYYQPYLYSPFALSYWGGGYWGGGFWNGYYGYPMFSGGFYCDPFNFFWACDPYSFLNSGFPLFAAFGFNLNLYNMYLENPLLLDPWGMSFYSPFPASPALSLFYPFSPFSPSTSLFPYSPTASSSISATDATSASSTDTSSSTEAPFGLNLNSTSSTGDAAGLYARNPAPGQPVTLVFSNGTSAQATRYWIGNGELHYVTTTGVSATIPLAWFDLGATMKVNERSGVHFLLPSSQPAPQAQKQ